MMNPLDCNLCRWIEVLEGRYAKNCLSVVITIVELLVVGGIHELISNTLVNYIQ